MEGRAKKQKKSIGNCLEMQDSMWPKVLIYLVLFL